MPPSATVLDFLFGSSPLGSNPVEDSHRNPQPIQAERSQLIQSAINIFRYGEGLDLSAQEIENHIVVDTTNDPYRIYRRLPIVIAVKGGLFKNCPLDRKPLLLVFVGRGLVADPSLILDPRSKLGLAHETAQLADSMEYKNATWEIPYHGKKTTFIIQDKDNWISLPVLYGPQDIYDLGLLMGKGGDRITRLGPKISGESGKSDEDGVFEEYARAMVTARLLGFSFIDGPDMMRDVDRRMGIMVEAVKGTVEDINQHAQRLGIPLINAQEVLKPTTSNPETEGGFSHMNWMVTSRGVVQGTISALRWLLFVLGNEARYLSEAVQFIRGLNIDFKDISGIVQGFGDVGSGIVKLLAALPHFGKFKITIRGISNKFFAIYHERGLDSEFLLEAREIAELDPDSLTLDRLLKMRGLQKNLAGATVWIANQCDRKNGNELLEANRQAVIKELFEKLGITPVFGDASIVNELMYQKATILFPAAAGNVINDISQVKRLRVSVIAEGANNAIERSLQPQLRSAGILYLPGELLNGGGIYTSKEDIRHNHTDGKEAIVRRSDYYRVHVTDKIDSLALHRTLAFLDLWMKDFSIDPVDHVRRVASQIFEAADKLVRGYINGQARDFIELVEIDQKRTAGKLPKRHSLYEIAVEMAPIGILYHPEDVPGYLELVESAGRVREDYSMDNFKICQVRFALFSLMKMSDSLSKEQRDRLVNLFIRHSSGQGDKPSGKERGHSMPGQGA